MALTTTVDIPHRSVPLRHFARLKVRVVANGFRGRSTRVALFAAGVLCGLLFAILGFLAGALPGLADSPDAAMVAAALGGGGVALAWVLLPLVFFGVDESIDPARFALLPLPRRTLVAGLLTAALVGVPAAATLLATAGLVLSAAAIGGVGPLLVEALGVVLGLLFCVAVSRAMTSAFSAMLRSRRMRDLAAVLLALVAALISPVQIAINRAASETDWHRFVPVGEIAGWTPFGAPYTAGFEVASGRPWAAAAKLAITIVVILGLMWWYSRTLESAMVGTASAGRATRQTRAGAPVEQLFPRILRRAPRTRFGAVLAREVRYWWRDPRRRANLISVTVVALFVSVVVNFAGTIYGTAESDVTASPATITLSMIFIGSLTSLPLANQFGFDGSAYAADVTAGVPGRVELGARATAYAVYVVPPMLVIAVVIGALLGEPGWIPLALGTLIATFGCGLAANLLTSVLGAYSMPETSNPFAIKTGGSIARSALSMLTLLASLVLAVPMLIGALFAGDVWLWLALPIGLLYGIGAAVLGSSIAGDALDRRMPELLFAVTPRR